MIGNQQGTLTTLELAWLAGAIDAAGHIAMRTRQPDAGEPGSLVELQIVVSMRDGSSAERAHLALRRLTGAEPLVETKRPLHDRPPTISVKVSRLGRIGAILVATLPHLSADMQARGRMALEFIERRMKRSRTDAYDAGDLALIRAFYEASDLPMPDLGTPQRA